MSSVKDAHTISRYGKTNICVNFHTQYLNCIFSILKFLEFLQEYSIVSSIYRAVFGLKRSGKPHGLNKPWALWVGFLYGFSPCLRIGKSVLRGDLCKASGKGYHFLNAPRVTKTNFFPLNSFTIGIYIDRCRLNYLLLSLYLIFYIFYLTFLFRLSKVNEPLHYLFLIFTNDPEF